MPIQRSGPTPNFFEYICNHALIPFSGPPSPQLKGLMAPGQQVNWVDIPSFQRGISWDLDNVMDLLESSSILLGNAILSQFNRSPGQFSNMPAGQQVYLVLVDGLQRFAVGTAFLSALHDVVLSANPSRPGDAGYFTALAARVVPLSGFYLHNNTELLAHPRQAIRDQYLVLRQTIVDYCNSELDAGRGGRLADIVVPLFLSKQVALDIYFNFNRLELLSTFIGINTVRVALGPVDLLRASILEKATIASWAQSDLEAIENAFTDTLTENQQPKQDFLPFINAALKAISGGNGKRLFPSWDVALKKHDVEEFLDFVDAFEAAKPVNSYLREICLCGKLPTSTVFAHYYLEFLHGSKTEPAFFQALTTDDPDLHVYLIACYRLLIDGSIGRTTDDLQDSIDGATALTLQQFSDSISVKYLGRTISTSVDPQWLESSLNGVDKKRAPRVFNAMLLPLKSNLGSTFKPLEFGRSSLAFHVDHLIPDSMLKGDAPGGKEGQTLRNFAPLPTNQNRIAKATSCSTKLSPGGIYSSYSTGTTHPVHPYCNWLLSNSLQFGPALDNQANLERNSLPDVGSSRVNKIMSELTPKI